ncbi:TetR family transcriptional regulator [Nocardia sp. ET3-3]|uniref:TetR family transcriptional regulator n=1 Tax=Nocardia terrae TaxID=2675851 RepID=A0A7K1UUU3_9NOCA|nr:TetR family transcriptional regulator [Nocardia terrae]MVU78133.1 TetR family transcriptional regulator [Nocardia terrae]
MGDATERTVPRRTMQQRREATVARLVDATIESICAVGVDRTSLREICTRAELSNGALFKQFGSRSELIAAASEEILTRLLAQFHQVIDHLADDENSLEASLRFLRVAMSTPLTHALRQIYMATLHDADLRTRIEPAVSRYYSALTEHVEQTGALNQFPEHVREPLTFIVLHQFSGEALTRVAYPRTDIQDRMLEITLDMLLSYAATLRAR